VNATNRTPPAFFRLRSPIWSPWQRHPETLGRWRNFGTDDSKWSRLTAARAGTSLAADGTMRLAGPRWMFAGLALAGLSACGGVSRLDGLGVAGSDAGGAASAGQGNGWHAGNPSGGSSAAGRSSGGASVCSEFTEQTPQPVTVKIRNDTGVPVYMGSRMQTCTSEALYGVLDASGTTLPNSGICSTPCQGFLDGNPIGGCVGLCLAPEVTRLNPGETLVTQWSGLYAVADQLPHECDASVSSGEGPVSCVVDRRIEPGSYTFVAEAGSDFTCDGSVADCPTCKPGTDGCTLRGATVSGSNFTAVMPVDLDAQYGIYGSHFGGPFGDGQVSSVELVFRAPL